MKVLSAYQDGRLCIYLHGELDHHEVKSAVTVIDRILDQYLPRECGLDLGYLNFMDSSGIALMLKLYRRMGEAGGRLKVENVWGQPLRVVDASGIGRLIPVEAKEEAKA